MYDRQDSGSAVIPRGRRGVLVGRRVHWLGIVGHYEQWHIFHDPFPWKIQIISVNIKVLVLLQIFDLLSV